MTDSTFQKAVAESTRPTLVVFYSEWCTTCSEMMPVVEQLAADYGDRLHLYKIDFDENLDSVVENGVMVVPTTFLFKGGQSLERVSGLQDSDFLKKRIEQHL